MAFADSSFPTCVGGPFRPKTRSPQVRNETFRPQPPNLRRQSLVAGALRSYARSPRLTPPLIRFLCVGSDFRSPLLSAFASRPPPCGSLEVPATCYLRGLAPPSFISCWAIGIGEDRASPVFPLPHHRTCGSASGGSESDCIYQSGGSYPFLERSSSSAAVNASTLRRSFRVSPLYPNGSSGSPDFCRMASSRPM